MVILDTNIFIYLAKGDLTASVINNQDIAHASIAKIEALGFGQTSINELLLLKSLFGESYNLPLNDMIVEQAVTLRQTKHMSLGDAIMAATAIVSECVLWTANTQDFKHIEKLKLFNPMISTNQ